MLVRPALTNLLPHSRRFTTSVRRNADFTHAVVGGGAVGLAIARRLQERGGGSSSTILIERHGAVGTETSSRNSEVIHAGLYYGRDSLKTKLCLKGKTMLYELCERYAIPYKMCGKWIVAQEDAQMAELEKVHSFARSIGVPTRFIGLDEGKSREPDVRAERGILESPSTGIVDSHAYMTFLHGAFEEAGGDCALNTTVTHAEPIGGPDASGGWKIHTTPTPKTSTTIAPTTAPTTHDGPTSTTPSPSSRIDTETTSFTADILINSAGLAAIPLSNSILPAERRIKPYYAKGTYYSYSRSRPKPRTLVYPAPRPGHGGLGTHLTIDMAGQVRFGPDVEWVDNPHDLAPRGDKMAEALDEIATYLPGVDRAAVALDYCGIRPKLGKLGAVASGKGFQDFYIKKEDGFGGNWINLLGIESPGLTSSLAIADEVHDLLYR